MGHERWDKTRRKFSDWIFEGKMVDGKSGLLSVSEGLPATNPRSAGGDRRARTDESLPFDWPLDDRGRSPTRRRCFSASISDLLLYRGT